MRIPDGRQEGPASRGYDYDTLAGDLNALPPFPAPAAAHPDRAGSVLDDLLAELTRDRPTAIKTYLDRYYSIDLFGGAQVTGQAWQNSFQVALRVSAAAALGCALAWREDFRAATRPAALARMADRLVAVL